MVRTKMVSKWIKGKINKTTSVHCATLCRKAKLIETILWGKDICNTFSNGPYRNFHLMVLHRYPIKDQVTITKRLEPLQNTELTKKCSTSYLFEEQVISEGSEWYQINQIIKGVNQTHSESILNPSEPLEFRGPLLNHKTGRALHLKVRYSQAALTTSSWLSNGNQKWYSRRIE